ncbi:MAG: molybdopterin converting factor subunit 1 [Rhodobacteraceae bacterium]|nr:MAG: molybdopterin converting factor subunit 1 [Paracoccaceae bacterium]
MNVMYFAWLRERIGVSSEAVETTAATVSELIDELAAREERYAVAFQDLSVIKVAVDQVMVDFSTPLKGANEVAFFPPMTGG